MADYPDINLGSIGFALEANTEHLERSLEILSRFGRRVEQLSKQTSEASQQMYRKFAQIERTLLGSFDKVAGVTEKLRQVGGDPGKIEEINRGYQRLTSTLTNMQNEVQPHHLTRAQVSMNALIQQGARAAKTQEMATRRQIEAQQLLFQAQQRVASLQSSWRIRGAGAEFFTKSDAALKQFEASLASGTARTEQMRAANRQLTAQLNQLNRELREKIAIEQQAAAIESKLSRQARNVGYVNLQAQRLGLPRTFAVENQAALRAYENSLRTGTITQQAAALTALNNAIGRTRQAMVGASDTMGRFARGFRDLERATILAVGPLSGLGARMAVLSALFDSASAKTALLIAGITGAVVSVGLLGAAGTRTHMEMERFTATLTAASGSAALVAEEYEYVTEVSQRLGHNVRELIDPYAKFATAARLSNMTLEQQREIFEATMVAATGMRLNSQRTGLAFLALEQMISKGSVTMEELRRQLGDLIPGSFELAAKAMGKTGSEFAKMVRAGEVLPNELLPRLAKMWMQVFGPSATISAQSLQAEINRLGTQVFEFNRAFDDTTKISYAVRVAVKAMADILQYLSKNMQETLALIAGVAGAFGGWVILRLVTTLVLGLNGAITKLVQGMATLMGLATGASLTLGGFVGLIAKIAAAVGGATLAYNLFNRQIDETVEGTESWLQLAETQLRVWKEIGSVQDRVAQQFRNRANIQLEDINREIQGINLAIEAHKIYAKTKLGNMADKKVYSPFEGVYREVKIPDSPEVKELQTRLGVLEQLRERIQKTLADLGKLKVETGSPNQGDASSREFDAWVDKIKQAIREHEKLKNMQAELSRGGDAQLAEAVGKANEIIADMPKKAGSIQPLIQALSDAGFSASTFKEQLVLLFQAIDKSKNSIQDTEKFLREYDSATKKQSDALRDIHARIRAAESEAAGMNPEEIRRLQARDQAMARYREILIELKLTGEGLNTQLREYGELWDRLQGAEKHAAKVRDLRGEIDKMTSDFGNKTEQIWRDYYTRVAMVNDAVALGIRTQSEGAVLLEQLHNDLNRKLLEGSNAYVRQTIQMLRRLEDSLAETFADMTLTGELSWKGMLDGMAREILTFLYKMQVVKPIMQGLFGDLYSGGASGNLGLLGPLLRPFISTGVPVGIEQAPAPVVDAVPAFVKHAGGLAGLGPQRMVSSSVFKFADRYHSGGLRVGEVPAILEEGEYVFTADQVRRGTKQQTPNVTVNVINQTQQPVVAEQAGAPRFDGENWVVDVVLRRMARDHNVRQRVKDMLTTRG